MGCAHQLSDYGVVVLKSEARLSFTFTEYMCTAQVVVTSKLSENRCCCSVESIS